MNKVILMGRLTRDPEVRYSQNGESPMAVARFSLAVDRRGSRNSADGQTADFINCVAFGRNGEFAEKYLRKGTKIAMTGRIQTGSYTNKDGVKVFTTEVVIEEQEFAESKNAAAGAAIPDYSGYQDSARPQAPSYSAPQAAPFAHAAEEPAGTIDGFMNLPDGIDEELPFT